MECSPWETRRDVLGGTPCPDIRTGVQGVGYRARFPCGDWGGTLTGSVHGCTPKVLGYISCEEGYHPSSVSHLGNRMGLVSGE